MKEVLIVSGHPDITNNSVANKTILDELSKLLPNAKINKLDVLYPNYNINVKSEQEKLVNADTIVLQYPLFWYGMPSLMLKWIEDVFTYGFSFGSKGKALAGKKLLTSITIGGSEKDYSNDSIINKHDLTLTARGLCAACGMIFSGCECLFDVSYAHLDEDAREIMLDKVRHYAKHIAEIIKNI